MASKKAFTSFKDAAHKFIDNYRQVRSDKSRNLNHTNRSVLYYAMFRKSVKPLRMTNIDLEVDTPHNRKIFETFKNDIEAGKESSDYLARVQVPFLTKEGDSGVAFNFVVESEASLSPFKARAQRKEIKKNKELMHFSDIFTPVIKDKSADDENVYLMLKGVTDVSYHLSVEDDNNATFDIPNIRNMLYDGFGRLIIQAGDEIFLFAYDNFLGRVAKVFKGYIKNVADNFDGTYYSVSLNLADYTWKLRNIHFNVSPGLLSIERIFGYPAGETLKDKMTSSLFMDELGKPISHLGTYTFQDWDDPKKGLEVSLEPERFFGGVDLASAISEVLTGYNYIRFFNAKKYVDISQKDALDFYEAMRILALKREDEQLGEIIAQGKTFEESVKSLKVYVAEVSEQTKSEKFPGMGFTLASNDKYTYVGRNQGFLDTFNSSSNSEISATKVPEFESVRNKLSRMLLNFFSADVIDLNKKVLEQLKKSAAAKEFLADRDSIKYFVVEPEVVKHTSYVLAFDNFKEVYESEYIDIFSFFKNMADQAGLLFYSDAESNYRLETIHCNDFPSAIITASDIQSWNFNEDVDGYVSRMDVTTNSSLSIEDLGDDINRLRWAMTVDFDILQKYGYKAEERTFTSGQPFGAEKGNAGVAFENGLALSMIASRKFLQMQNGRILGGNITIHPIPNLRLNTTVYIKPRNMIYTVMAIDDSASNESASRSITLALAFGRAPGRFYEGMFYSLDTELFPVANEDSRLNMIERIRNREWQLWVRDKNTYDDVLLKKLSEHTRDFTDTKLLEKVRERYSLEAQKKAKQVKGETTPKVGEDPNAEGVDPELLA